MAKNTKDTLFTAISSIFYFPGENLSRLYNETMGYFKDTKDKAFLLGCFLDGWDIAKGVLIVREMTKEEKEKAVVILESIWKKLRETVDAIEYMVLGEKRVISPDTKLRMFEQYYTKNGKVIVPQYRGIAGYRRNDILLDLVSIQHSSSMPIMSEVPIDVRAFVNPLQEMITNIEENEGKYAGSLDMGNTNRIRAAYALFSKGAKESELRKLFKAGTGQKLFAFMSLNVKHPDANLMDYVLADSKRFTSLSKEEMRKLLKEDKPTEEVKKYIESPKKKGNKPKIASRNDIERLLQSGIQLIRMTANAILTNKVIEFLEKYQEPETAKAINAAIEKAAQELKGN